MSASLEAAVAALQADDLGRAETLLQALLAAQPEQADALHFLGILRHRQGDGVAALALLGRAASLAPQHAGILLNLGNVHYESGRAEDAASAYRRAIELEPASAQAWSNLATVLHHVGDLAQARFAWQQAVQLDAASAEAWYGLSLTLIELGQVHEGLLANSRAIALWPQHLQAREQVIRALVLLERRDDAERLYREWLAEEPDNAVVRHQWAAVRGQDAPARAADAYLEAVFDSFAPHFDHKLAALEYRAPQLVVQAVAQRLPGPAQAALEIADLGCGTGLCGPLLRPWARRLVGCDLSTGMLTLARRRQCYDALFKVELAYFLQNEPGGFDLIVAADTLCYVGALDGVCRAAAGALRGAGHFVFTLEALAGEASPHRLLPTGRYAHSRGHVMQALGAAGWRDIDCAAHTLRQEAGLAVAGWVVVARGPN